MSYELQCINHSGYCPHGLFIVTHNSQTYCGLLNTKYQLKDYFLNSKRFNSLPNDKILDWCKLKEFADNKVNVDQIIFAAFDRREINMG